MEVPLTNVITLIVAIATAALSIGMTVARLATVLEKIKGLEKSRDLARDRFEKIERELARQDAIKEDRQRRRLTQPNMKGTGVPHHVSPEGSDDDE
jgi:hypothetical protein